MTKTLLTGDLHLSINPRDQYRMEFFKTLIAMAKQFDRVIIAGDITEEKDRHPAVLVNSVVELIHALARVCAVLVVEGNHDYKEEGHAFFEFLKRISNTRWISQPTVLDSDWLLLPHTNNYKRAWSDIDMEQYPFIVCHQTFNSASVGFGRKLEGIPLDVLPRKTTTFCGDIHVPQELGKLVYIGAPYHVDFGDDYKARVIAVSDRKWLSVDTSKFPQKRLIALDDVAQLKNAPCNKGDMVEIRIALDDMRDWQVTRDHLHEVATAKGLRVWAIKPILTKHVVRRRHKIEALQTDETIMDQFAKRHGLKLPILKTGLRLL